MRHRFGMSGACAGRPTIKAVDFCKRAQSGRSVSVIDKAPRPSLFTPITITVAADTSSGPCVKKRNNPLTSTTDQQTHNLALQNEIVRLEDTDASSRNHQGD